MKTIINLLVLLFFFSCRPDYVKVVKKIEGSWRLTRFSYINDAGKSIDSQNVDVTITFSKGKGMLKMATQTFPFTYNFGPDACDLDFTNEKQLPLEAIGKVQVYDYQLNGKNALTFSIDKEYYFAENKIIRNVKYSFSRI